MEFGSVEAAQAQNRARLAVVTKQSAKLSFLQLRIGRDAADRRD